MLKGKGSNGNSQAGFLPCCEVYSNTQFCTSNAQFGSYVTDSGIPHNQVDFFTWTNNAFSAWSCPECGCGLGGSLYAHAIISGYAESADLEQLQGYLESTGVIVTVPVIPSATGFVQCNPNADTWTDQWGYTCADYANSNVCTTDGDYGSYWDSAGVDLDLVDLDDWSDGSYSGWNCPECGCGSR